MRSKLLVLSLFFVSICVSKVDAQWTRVSAANLMQSGPYRNQGAMAYADGIAWAGMYDIYKSTDKGLTWTKVPSPWYKPGYVIWMSFLNRNNGIVCGEHGMMITHDGGATWSKQFWEENIFCAAFVGDSLHIVCGDRADYLVQTSSDGGNTWSSQELPNREILKDLRVFEPGHVIAFAETPKGPGVDCSEIVETTDYGATWKIYPGKIDPDCHAFEVSQCDHSIIIAINEEVGNYIGNDGVGEICRSSDGGNSFTTLRTFGKAILRGCSLQTRGMMYAPLFSKQMLESSDLGLTWTTTPGAPDFASDCHTLIAIEDTILLAFDADGTIFRKIDPRGAKTSSAIDPVLSTNNVDFTTRFFPCSPSESISIGVSKSCETANVQSVEVLGNDTVVAAFSASESDSGITVTFSPRDAGSYSGILRVTYTNGSTLDLPVTATVDPPLEMTITTSAIHADAIGETVLIPIAIVSNSGLDHGAFDIRYDTTDLLYVRAYREPNPTIDLTVASVPGRARVDLESFGYLPGDSLKISAVFRYFPTLPRTSVVFDSLDFNAKGKVACSKANGDTSILSSSVFCGQDILAGYVRYGVVPTFAEFMQDDKTLLIKSSTSINDLHVNLYNAVGTAVLSGDYDVAASRPLKLNLSPFKPGAYFGRISSASGLRYFHFEVLSR